MVSVSNINFQFNPSDNDKSAGQQVAETAAKAVSDALINALIGAGGGKEVAAAGARQAKTVSDSATSLANITQQQQIITTALTTITQMVQSGQMNISNFNSMLTQVLNSISDNNIKAEAMNEQIVALTEEKEEIQKELELLTGSTQKDSSMEKQDKPDKKNKTSEITISHSKSESSNPNQEKIDELMERLNANNQMIIAIKSSIADISTQQDDFVGQGQTIQQDSEQAHTDIVSSIQNFAQTKFSEFTSALNKTVSDGIQTQQAHSIEGLGQQASDEGAAAALTAKTAAEAGSAFFSSLFTFGIGGVLGGAAAAKDAAEAALFTSAAGVNGGVSVTALGNKPILQQMGNQLGNAIAQNLSQQVNEQLQGAITDMTNEILGEDIASKVSSKIMEMIQNQQDKL